MKENQTEALYRAVKLAHEALLWPTVCANEDELREIISNARSILRKVILDYQMTCVCDDIRNQIAEFFGKGGAQ